MFPLKNAMLYFENNHLADALNKAYSAIPSGKCDSCGACCYDNVPMSAVEFLNLVSFLKGSNQLEETLQKVSKWYKMQYQEVQSCIFLADMRCQVYGVRPLTCRLFGHQTKDEQDAIEIIIRQQKKEAALTLDQTFGIKVNKEVIDHVITSCGFISDVPFDKNARDACFDTVQMMDAPLYFEDLLPEEWVNMTLIEWFVAVYLDEDDLFESLER